MGHRVHALPLVVPRWKLASPLQPGERVGQLLCEKEGNQVVCFLKRWSDLG